MGKWEILDSKYLLRRKWMDVREDRVRLPNGVIIDEFHVLEYPDWVCIVPVTDEGQLVMVEQYRHGIQRICLEFPAGVVETGEDVVATACRELLEETGYEAAEFVLLGECSPEPSRHSNTAHIVLAKGARATRPAAPDADEVISVRTWPADRIDELIRVESFVHGVHYAAVLFAFLKGHLRL